MLRIQRVWITTAFRQVLAENSNKFHDNTPLFYSAFHPETASQIITQEILSSYSQMGHVDNDGSSVVPPRVSRQTIETIR